MGARVSSGKGSKQDYQTPWPFVRSLERALNIKFEVDLAGTPENKKAPWVITEEQNSFAQDWHTIAGYGWLNPPFADIKPWAKKWLDESLKGFRGVMLTPAAVETEWYRFYIFRRAQVLFPYPRIQFDGADDPFMKPLMVSCYNIDLPEKLFLANEWHQPWGWMEDNQTIDMFR